MSLMVCVCLWVSVALVWLVVGVSVAANRHVNTALEQIGSDASTARQTEGEGDTWYTCGEGHCLCKGVFADCSGKSLMNIPKLESTVEVLDLRMNLLSIVDLSCVGPWCIINPLPKSLKRLLLSKQVQPILGVIRGLEQIYMSSPSALTNLTYLDLSYNSLTCRSLSVVFNITSLKELVLTQAADCHQPDFSLVSIVLPKLEMLDISSAALPIGNISFALLPALKVLNLSYNDDCQVPDANAIFPLLQVLILRGCHFEQFPYTCMYNDKDSLFPSLVHLDVSENALRYKVGPIPPRDVSICLPNLHFLNLSGNFLFSNPYLLSDYVAQLNSSFALDVSAQKDARYITRDPFASSNLLSLRLDDNRLSFTDPDTVPHTTFQGCPHLQNLSLANNNFKGVSEERFLQLFGHLTHTEELSLRSTGIRNITIGMFRQFRSLRSLDLSGNSLAVLPSGFIQSLVHLSVTCIKLRSNKISSVQESDFPWPARQRLKQVDLSDNPFDCSCQVLWFRQWMLDQPSLFADSLLDYMCANKVGATVQSFFIQEQACLLSKEASQFIIATICLLFIVTFSVTMLYRYRWHIRLVFYQPFRGRCNRMQRLRELHFEYDVFVAYDSKDFPYVRDHLMPELEGRLGLKLCLHQRDFIPGGAIAENIMESVESSKKMLMLFSRNFAESQWCQFELQLCLTHSMDTDDVLLVVMLEDIPPRDLTPAMMAVMKTTTYIEWGDEDEARDSFWRRMDLALHEILPGV